MKTAKTLLLITTLLFTTLGLQGCKLVNAETEKKATSPAMAPANVSTLEVTRKDVPLTYEYVGQIAASREVEVHARITGIIEKRTFEEGRQVRQGDLLYQLEPSTYEYELAQAEAELVSARSELKRAEREYRRIKPLVKKKLVSQNQLDDADSTRELAQASVKLAQARVKSARVNLDYTRVTAPITGVAGRAMQVEGALASVGSNSLLTSLAQIDPVYVNFGIAENEQLKIKKEIQHGDIELSERGFEVVLLDSAGDDLGHHGVLDFQDYKVDTRTGNFSMRATVDNPDRMLSPGQFVKVRLEGAVRKSAVILPQRAILDDPKGKYVYVVVQNDKGVVVAMKRRVELGEWLSKVADIEHAWVVHSGLEPGDKVVVDGSARIFFPGMPVKATPYRAVKAEADQGMKKPS